MKLENINETSYRYVCRTESNWQSGGERFKLFKH